MLFPPIVWMKRHSPLKSRRRVIESLESYEAGGKSMQGVELSVEQLASFFEMWNRRTALSLPVFQHGQHGMGRGICWTQLQQMI